MAGLLTLALPGLGHVYVGDLRRGLALFAVFVVVTVGCLPILLYLPVAPWNVLLPLLLFLTVWLYIIIDAARRARLIEDFTPRPYNRWWVYLGALSLFAFVVLPPAQNSFEARVANTFVIDSGAMVPTLLPGDYLLVDKRSLRKGSLARFQIAVYRRGAGTYIHRIVGLPGDTLEMIQKVLHLNGDPVAEPYVQHREPPDVAAPAMLWQLDHLVDGERRPEIQPTRDNWGPLVVPRGHYFVLGDNRDESADSRYSGFVPRGNLLGKALRLYFSMGGDGGVRWNRIGQGIP